jgi:hypothetical protein
MVLLGEVKWSQIQRFWGFEKGINRNNRPKLIVNYRYSSGFIPLIEIGICASGGELAWLESSNT